MGKLESVVVAAIQYAASYHVFKKPDVSGCGPWVSSLIVVLALTILLWHLPIYPSKLRVLLPICDILMQFLVALFLIEYIMADFWFPLEASVLSLLPKIGEFLEETLMMIDVSCQTPCEAFKKESLGMCVSYILSIMILVAALHATRLIDLNLLVSSPACFCVDVKCKLQNFYKKVKKSIPNMKIGRKPANSRHRRSRKPDYCTSAEGFEFEPNFDQAESASTDTEYHYDYH